MTVIRWTAAAALTLISLMNIGTVLDGGDGPIPLPVAIPVAVLGAVGLAAAYGLVRRLTWGQPSALAVGVTNVVAAVIGLALDSDGAAIGLVVSAVATALAVVTFYGDQRRSRASIG
ncbi:hypothetical protein I6A60_00180 [Frankia sp. AgB1.9]|uniref:hypothetical protein n=1 Tax=unclassified Frankia TaxID=2632575 RepID=UPI0019337B89|nr:MULTISPECIES: hypothetical protein [unclassified Frankia]MBL7487297.1 hypothetical protein [Frankia sp. AgW1.1]MBL7546304.1 hypothetical protein [Frankia sp. AgB1.9]MBL7618651.1 hypothetical protein [Frankia sp. AgB1.8]